MGAWGSAVPAESTSPLNFGTGPNTARSLSVIILCLSSALSRTSIFPSLDHALLKIFVLAIFHAFSSNLFLGFVRSSFI